MMDGLTRVPAESRTHAFFLVNIHSYIHTDRSMFMRTCLCGAEARRIEKLILFRCAFYKCQKIYISLCCRESLIQVSSCVFLQSHGTEHEQHSTSSIMPAFQGFDLVRSPSWCTSIYVNQVLRRKWLTRKVLTARDSEDLVEHSDPLRGFVMH